MNKNPLSDSVSVSLLLGVYTEIELLDCLAVLFTFLELPYCLPEQQLYYFTNQLPYPRVLE